MEHLEERFILTFDLTKVHDLVEALSRLAVVTRKRISEWHGQDDLLGLSKDKILEGKGAIGHLMALRPYQSEPCYLAFP